MKHNHCLNLPLFQWSLHDALVCIQKTCRLVVCLYTDSSALDKGLSYHLSRLQPAPLHRINRTTTQWMDVIDLKPQCQNEPFVSFLGKLIFEVKPMPSQKQVCAVCLSWGQTGGLMTLTAGDLLKMACIALSPQLMD